MTEMKKITEQEAAFIVTNDVTVETAIAAATEAFAASIRSNVDASEIELGSMTIMNQARPAISTLTCDDYLQRRKASGTFGLIGGTDVRSSSRSLSLPTTTTSRSRIRRTW